MQQTTVVLSLSRFGCKICQNKNCYCFIIFDLVLFQANEKNHKLIIHKHSSHTDPIKQTNEWISQSFCLSFSYALTHAHTNLKKRSRCSVTDSDWSNAKNTAIQFTTKMNAVVVKSKDVGGYLSIFIIQCCISPIPIKQTIWMFGLRIDWVI